MTHMILPIQIDNPDQQYVRCRIGDAVPVHLRVGEAVDVWIDATVALVSPYQVTLHANIEIELGDPE